MSHSFPRAKRGSGGGRYSIYFTPPTRSHFGQGDNYTAFGVVAHETNSAVHHLTGFAGGLTDAHTGLTLFGERWYDAVDGVWMSQDPLGFKGGDANLARYGANNPANSVDRSGEFWEELFIFMSGEDSRSDRLDKKMAEIRLAQARSQVSPLQNAFAEADVLRKNQLCGAETAKRQITGMAQGAVQFNASGASFVSPSGAANGVGQAVGRGANSGARPSGVSMGPNSGLTHASDLARQYAPRIKPVPGFSDVVIHGTRTGNGFTVLHNGKSVVLDHRSLATYLGKQGIKGNIRLISCNAGAGNAAQNLANKLGVTVRAPTNTITIHENGALTSPAGTVWKDFAPGAVP